MAGAEGFLADAAFLGAIGAFLVGAGFFALLLAFFSGFFFWIALVFFIGEDLEAFTGEDAFF